MKSRLPVYIDNKKLPDEDEINNNYNESYGFVNVFYILCIILSIGLIMYMVGMFIRR